MTKIQAINCFAQNVTKLGMQYGEALTILAIAEMTQNGERVTCTEISKFMGARKQTQLEYMKIFLSIKEEINDRGKKSYLYRLNDKGIAMLEKLLCFTPMSKEEYQKESNKKKK